MVGLGFRNSMEEDTLSNTNGYEESMYDTPEISVSVSPTPSENREESPIDFKEEKRITLHEEFEDPLSGNHQNNLEMNEVLQYM